MKKNLPKIKNGSDDYPEERKPLLRTGVSALIINNRNEFLLINLESFESRFFAIPGGGTEPGEILKEAVYRELKEELGIKQEHLQIVGQSNSPVRFKFKVIRMNRGGIEYGGSERYFFGFKFVGDEKIIAPNPGEVRSYRWVSFDDLKDYLLFDSQLEETTEKIIELFPFLACLPPRPIKGSK